MCSKFNLDNLKTVGQFSDTTLQQQTDRLTYGLLTPVYPLPLLLLVGGIKMTNKS